MSYGVTSGVIAERGEFMRLDSMIELKADSFTAVLTFIFFFGDKHYLFATDLKHEAGTRFKVDLPHPMVRGNAC